MSHDDKFVTTGTVARALEVSSPTVIAWAKRGDLPVVRLANGHRIFRWRDVEALAARRAEQRAEGLALADRLEREKA